MNTIRATAGVLLIILWATCFLLGILILLLPAILFDRCRGLLLAWMVLMIKGPW
jgi:hypothetical protein